MKDIIVLQELTEELRKAGQEDVADALEEKTMNLYLLKLKGRMKNAEEQKTEKSS